MSDLRHAIRSLLKVRGFTLTAVLTLALGIGATTAVFAVVDAVLIRTLPYPDPERLVYISHVAPGLDIHGDVELSGAQWFTYREHGKLFEQIGLWSSNPLDNRALAVPGSAGGPSEPVRPLIVSDGTLQALGVTPLLGRWFSAADDTPGSPQTVLLTYDFWQHRFGGDPSAVGRTVTLDSQPREIIGVMPRGFRFLNVTADVILPMRLDRQAQRLGVFNYGAVGRLKPGVTLEQAKNEIARLDQVWMTSWPPPLGATNIIALLQKARLAPNIFPLRQFVVGNIGRVLWLVMGTIAVVFLIAIANVANLMLVRAETRRQEFAVRSALGAGRLRIARDWLAEGLVLSGCGAAFGLFLALAAVRLLTNLAPSALPRLNDIGLDHRAVIFACAMSLLSAALVSLLPMVRFTAADRQVTLLRTGRTAGVTRHQNRARSALIVSEIALSLVLLLAAGLMIRTVAALRAVQPGTARAEDVQLFSVSIPSSVAADADAVIARQQEIVRRLAALPGVAGVSWANSAPLDLGASSHGPLVAEGAQYEEGQAPLREFKFVAPEFFRVIGMPLIVGRELTWSDIAGHRPLVVVSERLARDEWGTPSAAIGKRVHELAGPWREVVGVVPDVRNEGLQQSPQATVYLPVLATGLWGDRVSVRRGVTFAVRSDRAGSESFLSEIRNELAMVIREVPVTQMRTLQELYDRALAPTAFTLTMLAIAATMALLLGVVGIYGVISYVVAQRTREIGIRAALGAPQRQLQRMFLAHGLTLAAIGIVLGVMAGVTVTRLMSSLLFGVTPLDPVTFAVTSAVLVGVSAGATYIPARRASKVDPIVALRYE